MRKPMKIIEWQLPVTDGSSKGNRNCIHGNAKIHCYIDGHSLCPQKYWMLPQKFKTTEYGEKDIETFPQYFCKKCVKEFKKMKES